MRPAPHRAEREACARPARTPTSRTLSAARKTIPLMRDSTLIALAGIAATATTGILSPWLTQRLGRSRDKAQHEHEIAVTDIAESRALVDEAAQNVARALELYRAVRSHVFQQGASFDERARSSTELFRSVGLQIDVDSARLSIRLGANHSLCEAHRLVSGAVADVVQHVWVAVSMGAHADLRETWETVTRRGDEMTVAVDAYTEAAVRTVGSRLPRGTDPKAARA